MGARRARSGCRGCAGRRSGDSWRHRRVKPTRIASKGSACSGRVDSPAAGRAPQAAAGLDQRERGAEALDHRLLDAGGVQAAHRHQLRRVAMFDEDIGKAELQHRQRDAGRGQRLEHGTAGAGPARRRLPASPGRRGCGRVPAPGPCRAAWRSACWPRWRPGARPPAVPGRAACRRPAARCAGRRWRSAPCGGGSRPCPIRRCRGRRWSPRRHRCRAGNARRPDRCGRRRC